MKKIITLAMAAGMMAAAYAPASAADVKLDGYWGYEFTQFSKGYKEDAGKNDSAFGRFQLGMTVTASENLSGYAQFRYDWQFGKDNDGVNQRFGTPSNENFFIRQAYIDWMIPNTVVKVRMGRQLISLPAMATGKNAAIWGGQPSDGIFVSAPATDWLNVSGFWSRYSRTYTKTTCENQNLDVFGLVANAKFDGFSISPYLVFGASGNVDLGGNQFGANNQYIATTEDGTAVKNNTWIAGVNATMTLFDPLTVKADFVYGDRDYKGDEMSQHGWIVDGSVAYATPYGTPSLTAYYATGDDKDERRGAGQLPSFQARNGFTRHYFNGTMLDDTTYNNRHSLAGTWGVKLAMDGISFMEDLSHSVAVAYVKGTNASSLADKDPIGYLTKKDSFVEFDFVSTYKIYKNLTAGLELAYVLEDFNGNIRKDDAGNAAKFDDGWHAALQFQYKF